MYRLFLGGVLACVVSVPGCEQSTAAAGSVKLDGDATPANVQTSDQYPAPHPSLPIAWNAGGPVIQSPILVPIVFQATP